MGIFIINNAFALNCKQSEIIPLADAYKQIELLSSQFIRIDHTEVLPQKINTEKDGFEVTTVQVLMCGELQPQSPTPLSTGQTCQFDSNCSRPMRCQNNVCILPNKP